VPANPTHTKNVTKEVSHFQFDKHENNDQEININ